MKFFSLTAIILFAVVYNINASIEISSFQMTTSDGITDNSIRYIFQDSKGFIWMGTLNGLSRYDGNTFVNYQPDTAGISLADKRVKNIVEDKNGFLWIATTPELYSCYDLKKEKFVDFTGCNEYDQKYSALTFASDSSIWLWHKGNGCRHIICSKNGFRSLRYNRDNMNLPSNNVRFVNSQIQEEIHIGTDKGIVRLKQGKAITICPGFNTYAMTSWENRAVYISRDGILLYQCQDNTYRSITLNTDTPGLNVSGVMRLSQQWILFTNKGGYAFNLNNKSVSRSSKFNITNGEARKDNKGNYWVYNHTGKVVYVNSKTASTRTFQFIPNDKVGYIDYERFNFVHDSKDIIWISTYGNGLFAYQLADSTLHHITAEIKGGSHISSNFLQFLMEDRTGRIWVSSEYTGVSVLSVLNEGASRVFPEPENLSDRSNTVRMISVMDQNDIWIGSRAGGVYRYNVKRNLITDKKYYHSNIYAVLIDRDGQYWLGSRGNGIEINGESYKKISGDSSSLSNNNIFTMLNDSSQRIWIGTFGGGLNLAVKKGSRYQFRHFLCRSYGLREIRALAQDRNGCIWAGTSDGLCIFQPDSIIADSAAYQVFDYQRGVLTNNEVKCIYRDSNDEMWIGTSGGGLSKCSYDHRTHSLTTKNYNLSSGLINDMVQSIVEDKNNRLWIATEYGISCFDSNSSRFRNFFFSSCSLGNVYSDNSAARLSDGRLAFGSHYGLVIINPEVISMKSQSPPLVALTSLFINGIKMQPQAKDSPLVQALIYTGELALNHNQNSFIIDFSIFDYSHSKDVKYSYMLENYDKSWSNPSNINSAAYKNVSPGKYKLKVRACNSLGVWSSEPTQITIVIRPPFWRSTPAFIIYLGLLAIILYVTLRILNNFNSLRNRIQLETQLTEYKLQFFTNISHEFRTPLTLINGALERLHQSREIPQDMDFPLRIMDKSIQRMLRLVNQLLEFRKKENNKLTITLEQTDIVGFIHDIYESFQQAAILQNIDYSFSSSIPSYYMLTDKDDIDKIVYNLLSNSFNYTPDGGKIVCSVTVDMANRDLIISVCDTGVGIPLDKQKQLFSRFMQTSFSKATSSGVGLHLTHELVLLLKGQIEYNENPGGGSLFTVTLPVSSEQPQLEYLQKKSDNLSQTDIRLPIPPNWNNNHSLLIIEDDHDVREFLRNELSRYFQVKVAIDGTSGLKCVSESEIELIICDILMPGIDGFEVTRRLKSDFTSSHIPVILLTAMSGEENRYKGISNGADAYITKPFSLKLLFATTFNLINQREVIREKFSSTPKMPLENLVKSEPDIEFSKKLEKIMEQEISNSQFSVDDFASTMQLGRTVFYRKVRGITGYTPNEYIRIMRMKKAAQLLLEDQHTISEISYMVGISDPFYFSKCFKQQFGVPPSHYNQNS